MTAKPCEMCALAGVDTPSTQRQWGHRALQGRQCRYVSVCDECATDHDIHDDCESCEIEQAPEVGMYRGSSYPHPGQRG